MTSQPNSTLGIGLVIAVGGALGGRAPPCRPFITSNVAYTEDEKRGFLRFQAAAFGLTGLAVVFAVLSIAFIGVLPAASEHRANEGAAFKVEWCQESATTHVDGGSVLASLISNHRFADPS